MRGRAAKQEDFVWSAGVHVAGTSIWCDAARRHQVTFAASAASGVGGKIFGRLVATARTAELLGELLGARGDVLVTPFGRPFALGRLRLELLPSGRMPGAAQLLVEKPGRKLLYAGALNPRGGRLAEAVQVRACDVLAMAAPLAATGRALAPREEVERALVDAVAGAIADGATPILLAPVRGAAEEAAAILDAAQIPLRAHARIAASLRAYVKIGALPRSPARNFSAAKISAGAAKSAAENSAGKKSARENSAAKKISAENFALLWPLELADSPSLAKIPNARRLLVGDAAIDPAAAERFGCAASFALADHGDLPSLIDFALQTGAREIRLTAGFTDEVARAFAARRLRARPLGPPEQMALLDGGR